MLSVQPTKVESVKAQSAKVDAWPVVNLKYAIGIVPNKSRPVQKCCQV